jgi:hypothetical protein
VQNIAAAGRWPTGRAAQHWAMAGARARGEFRHALVMRCGTDLIMRKFKNYPFGEALELLGSFGVNYEADYGARPYR